MPTEGERLATVEAVLVEMRQDLGELKTEALRTRSRLHQVENTAALFLKTQEDNREKEAAQYRRLGLWVGIVGVLLTAAVLLSPILHYLITRK